jgi:hypothetical protein
MALALAATVAPASTGCTTRQCDGHTSNWTAGRWIDANTWQTNDVNDAWIPFDGNSTVNIYWSVTNPYAQALPRDILNVFPYIGVSDDGRDSPNGDSDAGNNFTNAAGQPVEYLNWPGPGGQPQLLTVFNDSCAPYLASFVVQFIPLSDDAGTAPDARHD